MTALSQRRWRARAGAVRLALWKLGTKPYNALVVLATSVVILQARAWKIRAT
jgi:hypothetical protein